jgi:hypothetical protein
VVACTKLKLATRLLSVMTSSSAFKHHSIIDALVSAANHGLTKDYLEEAKSTALEHFLEHSTIKRTDSKFRLFRDLIFQKIDADYYGLAAIKREMMAEARQVHFPPGSGDDECV